MFAATSKLYANEMLLVGRPRRELKYRFR